MPNWKCHHYPLEYFDVVSMARTVRVAIVTVLRHVLNVGYVDCDASRLLFWSIINLVVTLGFRHLLLSQN